MTEETNFRLDGIDDELNDVNLNMNITEYYSSEKLKYLLSQKRDDEITAICWNIRSLPKRFVEFTTTLSMLNFTPDIIALSETNLTTKSNSYYNPKLPNYTYYYSKSNTKSGSVGVFINNSFTVDIRHDLDISVPGIFETV